MYFKNSIGAVYIKDRTIVYEDSEGIVIMTPNDPTRVRFLYEFYVEQFKEIEKMEAQAKRFKDMMNNDSF